MDSEIIDISGDVGIRAFGLDMAGSFINAGLGMYSLVADPNTVEERERLQLVVSGDTPEELLVHFLNELIFEFDANNFIGKRIGLTLFKTGPGSRLEAVVYGERFDPSRHDGKLLIKAATYHKLRVDKTSEGWITEVIFDI